MIEKIKLAGKYLDQPLLVAKFQKTVPYVFTGGAALFGAYDVSKNPKSERKKAAINDACILGATVASSLVAPRIASKAVGKKLVKLNPKKIIENNTQIVDEFIQETTVSKKTNDILQKAKTKILNIPELNSLNKELKTTPDGKNLLNSLFPEPQNVTSKDIKNEIGRLSVLGLVPVIGGVAGGIAGEKLSTGKITKEKSANRIKEGAYQYLANIFLCNIGAGAALAAMEKLNVKSKAARITGMVAGIVATGIVGGSAIANYIGDKVINPIVDGEKDSKNKNSNSNSKRRPEVVDICLHTDDIATVAVMSGLKWIEPALPILYGVSGYRAGIGYRNGNKNKKTEIRTQA